MGMRRRDLTVRAAGLILTGELAVHELRYLIAGTPQSGHGYLPLLGAFSVLILAIGAGQLAGVLERARTGGRDERISLRFRSAWPALALCIAALFSLQEMIEALLGGAGTGAVVAVIDAGGWVAYPLALGVAALLALALTGARAAVSAAARAARASIQRRRLAARRLPAAVPRPAGRPLALNLAGRAPPLRA